MGIKNTPTPENNGFVTPTRVLALVAGTVLAGGHCWLATNQAIRHREGASNQHPSGSQEGPIRGKTEFTISVLV